MIKVILYIFIYLFPLTCVSQHLFVDKLIISDAKVDYVSNVINEGKGNGPQVWVELTLCNNTNEDIFIEMSFVNLMVIFNYEGKEYREEMIWQSLTDETNQKLSPNTSLKFSAGTYIFLGTELWHEKKENYMLELLKTLPTLRIKLYSPQLEIESIGIESVIVN